MADPEGANPVIPPPSLAIDFGPLHQKMNMRYWETVNWPQPDAVDPPHDVALSWPNICIRH